MLNSFFLNHTQVNAFYSHRVNREQYTKSIILYFQRIYFSYRRKPIYTHTMCVLTTKN